MNIETVYNNIPKSEKKRKNFVNAPENYRLSIKMKQWRSTWLTAADTMAFIVLRHRSEVIIVGLAQWFLPEIC